MSVNRSGYYKWLNRDLNQYERNRRDLARLIREEHARHPSYGYHALAKVIRDRTGWIFSDSLCHKAQIRTDYKINDYDSIEDFINQYIRYYNHERPMYKLNYKSPAEYTLSQGFKLIF